MKQIGIIFGALLGFLVITIWVPIQTHIAMQNAFAYKKGKAAGKRNGKCSLGRKSYVCFHSRSNLRSMRHFICVFFAFL